MSTLGLLSKSEMAARLARMKGQERAFREELAKAVNKAAREAVNLSIDEWNLMMTAKDYAKPRLDIASGATADRPFARIKARNRSTRANRFRHFRAPGGGVHLNIRRGRAGAVIRNAFIINAAKSDGKPLILERLKGYEKGEARNFKDGRFRALYAPSVNQFFHDSRERVAPQALSAAKEQFLKAVL